MKNSTKNPLQSSELFCKVQTSGNAKLLIVKENGLNELCSLQACNFSLQSSKTKAYQPLSLIRGLYCRPPISYRDREAIPADAVLPLSYCVRVARAQEVV